MEAEENRKLATCNIPNTFTHTKLDDASDRIILVLGGTAAEILCEMSPIHKEHSMKERNQSVIYLECTNVICGTLKAALLFHKAFKNDMEAVGFKMNPCDRCTSNKIANGKHMTTVWHVDDVKASHADLTVLEEHIECLQSICDDE